MIKYILYVDILGFEKLPQEISQKTGFHVDTIRQDYFSKPFKDAFIRIKKRCIQSSECISEKEGSDNYILVVDSFHAICELISNFASIRIPHKDYANIPIEIALDAREFDVNSEIELINQSEIIRFLKNDILSRYRKYYKGKYGTPTKSTFIVATENSVDQLESIDKAIDKSYYEKVIFDNKKFCVINFIKIMERCKVFNFLKEIHIEGSKLYERINDLYIPPIEYEEITQALEKNRIVFITGTAEYGKTYTAIRLLWEYFLRGYKPVWVTGAEERERVEARKIFGEIESILKPHHIIYFEDPFGKIKYERKEDLERNIGGIIERVQCKNDAFVTITSREEIFKEFAKENLSSIELKIIERKLNLKKPSYNYEKRKQILIGWAKAKDCAWLKISRQKKLVLEYLKDNKYLPTPLSIREFVISSSQITETSKLKKKIEDKSEETSRAFAKEVENMSLDKSLFLSFPFIYPFKINFIKKTFNELVKSLDIKTSGFDEILAWFKEDKIDIKGGKIDFAHPSYKEAKRYLLIKNGKPTEMNIKIFSNVLGKIAEKGESEKEIVILEIIESYELLIKNSQELLRKLIKGENSRIAAAISTTSRLDDLPVDLRKIHSRLLENSRIAGSVVLYISDMLKKLPRKARNLRSKLLKREAVAQEAARLCIMSYKKSTDESKQLLVRLIRDEKIAQAVSICWINNLNKIDVDLKDILFSSLTNENVALFLAVYLIISFNKLTQEKKTILFNLLKKRKIMEKAASVILRNPRLFPKVVEANVLDKLLARERVVLYLLVELAASFDKLPKKSENALTRKIKKELLPKFMLLAIAKKKKMKPKTDLKFSQMKISKQIKEGYKYLLKIQKN
jgi:hypothetical protein